VVGVGTVVVTGAGSQTPLLQTSPWAQSASMTQPLGTVVVGQEPWS
jgi:hypothetical protein